jgi:5-methylcytosine-specific restriction protein A
MTWKGDPRTSTAAWKALRLRILRRDQGICGICGKAGADVVDHIVPHSLGGSDDPGNLQAVHEVPCHRAKTAAEGAAARLAKYDRRRPKAPHPGMKKGSA